MKNTLLKIALGLIVGLFISGCLVVAVFLRWEEESKTLKTQNINTLEYEFKEGTPSLNFMDRAKQVGATRILVTPGADSAEHPGVECDDSNGFYKLNAKYKLQSDGSARAVFLGRTHPFIFEIYFKHGKVTQAKAGNIVCGTCGAN